MISADVAAVLQHALRLAGMAQTVDAIEGLSGGCIHSVMRIQLGDGQRLIAKVNRESFLNQFECEALSLRVMAATKCVLVPRPLIAVAHNGRAVLLMTEIAPAGEPLGEAHWQGLGRDLAAMHEAECPTRYGFDRDNFIGSNPQPNCWCDNWVTFNAVNRLGFQAALAFDQGLLEPTEHQAVQTVIDRLEQFIPRHPAPSLLHGDLWSGNALGGTDPHSHETRIALIDPAAYIGDAWADIAMMKLFGGFPSACFQAYQQQNRPPVNIESRIAVYQLYHVLNHINLFGRSYAAQAMSLVRQLLRTG